MLPEVLQDRAALYVAGALAPGDRENFELVLAFHEELRAHVADLQDATTAAVAAGMPAGTVAPVGLKARLLQALEDLPPPAPPPAPDPMVVTNSGGEVEWINPAFAAMCGHTLAELRGRKPGTVLQGPETDAAAVARIRESLQARRPCRETLVNYHKDGSSYRVDIRITPVLDDERQPLWFVAQERKLA